mmetsp:Transcript_19764/g.54435  ORF Transcript_19764/g.54435 Transcript_19764/m.54435 type:complete len:209 (-) Transcript_19764:174-800(-)
MPPDFRFDPQQFQRGTSCTSLSATKLVGLYTPLDLGGLRKCRSASTGARNLGQRRRRRRQENVNGISSTSAQLPGRLSLFGHVLARKLGNGAIPTRTCMDNNNNNNYYYNISRGRGGGRGPLCQSRGASQSKGYHAIANCGGKSSRDGPPLHFATIDQQDFDGIVADPIDAIQPRRLVALSHLQRAQCPRGVASAPDILDGFVSRRQG